ncbi:hypothetical protein BC828DRAFT_380417 [Blastocladiella britannica]|nr:hypothetical protein BC828DRAFT_380417 [Blastocladiella britannica]
MATTADCAIVSKFSFSTTAAAITATSPDCCTWSFVACTNGRVTGLALENGKVQGPIPSDIGLLSGLSVLSAVNNALTGDIPNLAGLTSLEYLNLANNQLSGAFPSSILKLPKLSEIHLYTNQLTGSIPSDMDQLAGTLLEFNVGNNRLTGTLPGTIGKLAKLTIFHADNNGMTGPIPATFNQLSQLKELWLYQNKLTELPDLSRLSNLQSLLVYENTLSGRIPSLPSPSANCTISSTSAAEANKFECYAGTTSTGLCYKSISALSVCSSPAPVTPPVDPNADSFTTTDTIILIVMIVLSMLAGYGVSVCFRRRKERFQERRRNRAAAKEAARVAAAASTAAPAMSTVPTTAAAAPLVVRVPPPAYTNASPALAPVTTTTTTTTMVSDRDLAAFADMPVMVVAVKDDDAPNAPATAPSPARPAGALVAGQRAVSMDSLLLAPSAERQSPATLVGADVNVGEVGRGDQGTAADQELLLPSTIGSRT